jgi:hypothetical protein
MTIRGLKHAPKDNNLHIGRSSNGTRRVLHAVDIRPPVPRNGGGLNLVPPTHLLVGLHKHEHQPAPRADGFCRHYFSVSLHGEGVVNLYLDLSIDGQTTRYLDATHTTPTVRKIGKFAINPLKSGPTQRAVR